LVPSFSYTWDQTGATSIPADGTGTGSISISVGSGSATAPTTIVAANLSVISSAIAPIVDSYTNKAYQLTLHLTDTASDQTGNFVFNGLLSGTANTTSSNFTNKYSTPTHLTEHIGAFLYHVAIGDPVLPPITGGSTVGGISALVTADPFTTAGGGGGNVGGNVQETPEPSTILLTAFALPVVAGWRRFLKTRQHA
jgi:hypothetical protein